MIIQFLLSHPLVIGLVTLILMLSDYFLSLAQEKERKQHYSKHYESYPVNTIEGNPALRESISNLRILNPRHLTASLIISAAVPVLILFIPDIFQEIFLGYIWGLYLIVCSQHFSNLIGYRVSRKGLHGKLWLHQRTGYLIQSGRYFSMTLFLLILSILSESQIIAGVTCAALISSLRLYVRKMKISPIGKGDFPADKINNVSQIS